MKNKMNTSLQAFLIKLLLGLCNGCIKASSIHLQGLDNETETLGFRPQ